MKITWVIRKNSGNAWISIRMVVITAQNYDNAKVHTITLENRELFWVKMTDLQDGLGVKNISDLVSKEIYGIFETKNLTKERIRKHKM